MLFGRFYDDRSGYSVNTDYMKVPTFPDFADNFPDFVDNFPDFPPIFFIIFPILYK